ncbi:MAG: hypothetical protein EOP67_17945 [Sphingomonas sp.]|nr:MAG: hypothetical protein EOP67_17945 [Sphingomonas sp.]
MALLNFADVRGYRALDAQACRVAGSALTERYASASPFPHIAIDDFVPREILRDVLTDFPARREQTAFDRHQERLKYQFSPQQCGSAVIFNTDLDSYHGHPDPLACPVGRSRRSIATYYYTVPRNADFGIERETQFRVRPVSDDRRDWKMILHHVMQDWTPPALRKGRRGALLPRLLSR